MGATSNGGPAEVTKRPQSRKDVKSASSQSGPFWSFAWMLSIVARLGLWYTVYVAISQCPSSIDKLDKNSSPICKPYLTARSHIDPYIGPYYDRYAKPYVEQAGPYVDLANERVVKPASAYAHKTYNSYAAPRVDQARDFGLEQWLRAKPQIDAAQAKVKKQYDSAVAPHVEKASAAAAPYLKTGQQNVVQAYNEKVVPAYTNSQPYLQQVYAKGHSALADYGYPYVTWIWTSSSTFLSRSLWPQIRILYGENVEPQLQRISERLGRYRDGRKLQAVANEDVDDALSAISGASPASTAAESIISEPSSTPSAKHMTPEEAAAALREKIDTDLAKWREKFSKAADIGSEDLKARVQKIADRQIDSHIPSVGDAHIVRLEETVASETSKLKAAILEAVQPLALSSSNDEFKAQEEKVSDAVKAAGLAIKTEAQSVRAWKQAFTNQTESLIVEATTATLDVLDSVRDLGLQEIGMRWANMEGIQYRDWERYNELRKTLDEWRGEVEAVAMEHKGFVKAKAAADEVQAKGMQVAEEAATELARLKKVGIWKVKAIDNTDDFESKAMPAEGVFASKKAAEMARIESLNSVAAAASEAAAAKVSAASKAVVSEEEGAAQSASTRIVELSDDAQKQLKENVMDPVAAKIDEASTKVSEAVYGSSTPATEAAASSASSMASGASDAVKGAGGKVGDAASSASDSAQSMASGASEAASSASSAASSRGTAASSKVFAGAMAQEAPIRIPIMDDDLSGDAMLQKFMEQAADVTRAVKEAMSPTSTQGTVESVTSVAINRYEKALAAASTALYGPELGAGEKLANAAAEKYAEALTAASHAVYGSPTSGFDSIVGNAKAQYTAAASSARAQYDAAKAAASEKISGTPEPAHQQALASIESAYAEATAAASSQLDVAVSAASVRVYGTPPSAQESILSLAEQKYSNAIAYASHQLEAAKTAVGATPKPTHDSLLSAASASYASMADAAKAEWAAATSAASSYVAPSPTTGVLESISALASSRLADALGAASSQFAAATSALGPTPTPASEQYLREAQRQYYLALGLAQERSAHFFTQASHAAFGTPTPTAMLEAAQSQFYAASAAASSTLTSLVAQASEAAGGKKKQEKGLLAAASSQYDAGLSAALAGLSSASSAASGAVVGTSTPPAWHEAAASSAAENWSALVSAASEQIYGAPTPTYFTDVVMATAAAATSAAASQYARVSALVSELVIGKEPDFTESVLGRLGEVYSTQVASASSLVAGAVSAASSATDSMVKGATEAVEGMKGKVEEAMGKVKDEL